MANALFTLWRKVRLKELAAVLLSSETEVPGEVM